jgi:hypothetical protein
MKFRAEIVAFPLAEIGSDLADKNDEQPMAIPTNRLRCFSHLTTRKPNCRNSFLGAKLSGILHYLAFRVRGRKKISYA